MTTRAIGKKSGDLKIKKYNLKKSQKKDIDEILYYQGLLYISKIVTTKLISRNQDTLLAGYFDIKKTQELRAPKFY